ncbi:M48 family metalloprotease [Candidatus Falkowbacteria bacterium]|jgi:Zn-dependent protease with chaperone function|nr:M48 family metalloprotease [Candidatus Falkowbacteria bacterium]MBT5503731.1 M48 family metalloprotease [Candidatus Falkowbacteria bacterium]MBT6573790.1 M48 family metalloprotease [Candidatus Falkowbacteria bacterium]MBT7348120.1 M48 family metalloprotease [Candidatus Falkowbacteria bacterium]MBT7500706.1 M48 family metalloprotease [Candidatus Falkowbacteria bacterium]
MRDPEVKYVESYSLPTKWKELYPFCLVICLYFVGLQSILAEVISDSKLLFWALLKVVGIVFVFFIIMSCVVNRRHNGIPFMQYLKQKLKMASLESLIFCWLGVAIIYLRSNWYWLGVLFLIYRIVVYWGEDYVARNITRYASNRKRFNSNDPVQCICENIARKTGISFSRALVVRNWDDSAAVVGINGENGIIFSEDFIENNALETIEAVAWHEFGHLLVNRWHKYFIYSASSIIGCLSFWAFNWVLSFCQHDWYEMPALLSWLLLIWAGVYLVLSFTLIFHNNLIKLEEIWADIYALKNAKSPEVLITCLSMGGRFENKSSFRRHPNYKIRIWYSKMYLRYFK